MVDEFQDTNRRQLELLACSTATTSSPSATSSRRSTASGTPRWRSSASAPNSLVACGSSLALTLNFRSRPALVATVGGVFEERLRASRPPPAARERDAAARCRGRAAADPKAGWRGFGRRRARGARRWAAARGALAPRRGAPVRPPGRRARRRRRGRAAATWRCCCARSATSRSTSGPCSSRALPRWPPPAPTGRAARSKTCSATCGCSPTPWTSWPSTRALAGAARGLSHDGMALLALAAQERGGGPSSWRWEPAPSWASHARDELALTRFCDFVQQERAQAPLRAIAELIARAVEQRAPARADRGPPPRRRARTRERYKLAAWHAALKRPRVATCGLPRPRRLPEENVRSGGEADAPALSTRTPSA